MRESRELDVAAISFQREREMRAETSKCKGVREGETEEECFE